MTDSDNIYILEEIEHRLKIELEKNLKDDVDEECFTLILIHFFISSIELLYMIFTLYVYTCEISDYLIMSFIFNIYFFLSICYLLVKYL